MQLKPKAQPKSIRAKLMGATAALLTVASVSNPIAAATSSPKFKGTIGHLYYSEKDRVMANEPVVELITEFVGEKRWTNKLVIDTLTGPSHNGGVPSRNAQTIATPSGAGTFRTEPGDMPLDPSFRDTRIAFSTSWSQPLGSNYEYSVGANYSGEYDFKSFGANTIWSRYFNRKNSKASFGLSYEEDTINPVGQAPLPLTAMIPKQTAGSNKSKTIIDLLFGWTQVFTRKFILQVNYSLGLSDGYQNDPYKILTEVKAPGDPSAGDPSGTYIYENRPKSRQKNSLFIASKYHVFKDSVWGTSYRYFWDDWGLTSHTLSMDLRIPITQSWSLTPDVRYYKQNRADFYRYFLIEGDALPSHATADYRLGNMDAYTIGLKGTKRLSPKGDELSVHLQYYEQRGEGKPNEAYGALKNLDLAPPIKTTMVRLIYTF